MKKHYQYILAFLLVVIVYEVYLVILYKYRDFQINAYITSVLIENARIEQRIEEKKEYLAYVKTNGFLDYTAKSSQNRKNPGEEVVFLVSPEEIEEYKRIDTNRQIVDGVKKEYSITRGMTNPQRWIYYIFHMDMRN